MFGLVLIGVVGLRPSRKRSSGAFLGRRLSTGRQARAQTEGAWVAWALVPPEGGTETKTNTFLQLSTMRDPAFAPGEAKNILPRGGAVR